MYLKKTLTQPQKTLSCLNTTQRIFPFYVFTKQFLFKCYFLLIFRYKTCFDNVIVLVDEGGNNHESVSDISDTEDEQLAGIRKIDTSTIDKVDIDRKLSTDF